MKTLFYFTNIFMADNGNGLGANHQTGWTSLVAQLISELHGKISK